MLAFIGNPYSDSNIRGDPYRTLFVSNLVSMPPSSQFKAYKTDEKTLREAFEPFGRIRRVRIIVDQKTGRPRGYAFIEYDSESDFQRKRHTSFIILL
jgi:U1 small nuclear ribonucleoprotein